MCVCIENFFHKSVGEKTLKIGPHLPKLLSNIKQLTLLEHGIVNYSSISIVHSEHQQTETDDQIHFATLQWHKQLS